jgi:hypothetical protein
LCEPNHSFARFPSHLSHRQPHSKAWSKDNEAMDFSEEVVFEDEPARASEHRFGLFSLPAEPSQALASATVAAPEPPKPTLLWGDEPVPDPTPAVRRCTLPSLPSHPLSFLPIHSLLFFLPETHCHTTAPRPAFDPITSASLSGPHTRALHLFHFSLQSAWAAIPAPVAISPATFVRPAISVRSLPDGCRRSRRVQPEFPNNSLGAAIHCWPLTQDA